MSKRITISDEEYFKLLEIKARLKTDSLLTILALVQIGNLSKAPEAKAVKMCPICGHPASSHSDGACLADGGMCECTRVQD